MDYYNLNKEDLLQLFCKVYSDSNSPPKIRERNTQDKNGNTLLHWCIIVNNMESFECLAGKISVDLNLKNNSGHTPLDVAHLLGREEMAKVLIYFNSDAGRSLRDHFGFNLKLEGIII